jgi:hypothetical protein
VGGKKKRLWGFTVKVTSKVRCAWRPIAFYPSYLLSVMFLIFKVWGISPQHRVVPIRSLHQWEAFQIQTFSNLNSFNGYCLTSWCHVPDVPPLLPWWSQGCAPPYMPPIVHDIRANPWPPTSLELSSSGLLCMSGWLPVKTGVPHRQLHLSMKGMQTRKVLKLVKAILL